MAVILTGQGAKCWTPFVFRFSGLTMKHQAESSPSRQVLPFLAFLFSLSSFLYFVRIKYIVSLPACKLEICSALRFPGPIKHAHRKRRVKAVSPLDGSYGENARVWKHMKCFHTIVFCVYGWLQEYEQEYRRLLKKSFHMLEVAVHRAPHLVLNPKALP